MHFLSFREIAKQIEVKYAGEGEKALEALIHGIFKGEFEDPRTQVPGAYYEVQYIVVPLHCELAGFVWTGYG